MSNTSGIVNLSVFCVLVIVLQEKQQIGPLLYNSDKRVFTQAHMGIRNVRTSKRGLGKLKMSC